MIARSNFPDFLMHSNTVPACQLAVKSVAVLGFLAVAACSDANPVRDTFAAVGAGPQRVESPDFVQSSRPANLDFIPVGTAAAERPTKAKTAEEVKAAEAEMDAIRTRNEQAAQVARQAGQTPPPKPVKLPVGKTPAKPPAASATP
jgi:hypothetical protein